MQVQSKKPKHSIIQENVMTLSDHNRLGINYRAQASLFPWCGDIWDVHTHIQSVDAAKVYFEVAKVFGVTKTWSMSNLRIMDELKETYRDRIEFIAVPDFMNYANNPNVFTSDWLKDIEIYASKGVRICKFWCSPRSRDFHEALTIDSPIRKEAMKLAHSLGMMFMMHIADPDTWFETQYRDSRRYGTKRDQYIVFEQILEEYPDTPLMAAHLAGSPEDLDYLQVLLDRHPNLYLDSSATKWMIRELGKQPERFKAFLEANPNRIFFGSDIVANDANIDFDLYASRYWALRMMYETSYEGFSPIVDPDLHMTDSSVPRNATPKMRGASLSPATLGGLYRNGAEHLEKLKNL